MIGFVHMIVLLVHRPTFADVLAQSRFDFHDKELVRLCCSVIRRDFTFARMAIWIFSYSRTKKLVFPRSRRVLLSFLWSPRAGQQCCPSKRESVILFVACIRISGNNRDSRVSSILCVLRMCKQMQRAQSRIVAKLAIAPALGAARPRKRGQVIILFRMIGANTQYRGYD
jgi:hypothetical protein